MGDMSIAPIGSQTMSPLDRDRDEPRPTETPKHDFDFAGAAYATVHLPALSPRTTLATVSKDLSDFEGKLSKLRTDLASPGMRAWMSKHVAATKTGASLGLKLALMIVTLALFKEKGAAVLLSAEGVLKMITSGEKLVGLVGDCQTLAKQIGEEHVAAKAAHPDVVRIERDLLDAAASGAKLSEDLRALGGT